MCIIIIIISDLVHGAQQQQQYEDELRLIPPSVRKNEGYKLSEEKKKEKVLLVPYLLEPHNSVHRRVPLSSKRLKPEKTNSIDSYIFRV